MSFIEESNLNYQIEKLKNLKKCSRCILPETYPFIKFNENNAYSDKGEGIKLFEEKFLVNLSDHTSLDYFDCKINLSLKKKVEQGSEILIPYKSSEFTKYVKFFYDYFRIEGLDKKKDVISLRYKKVDNYHHQKNIIHIITKLKDPDNGKLSNEEVINYLKDNFHFSEEKSNKSLQEWNDYYESNKVKDINLIKNMYPVGIRMLDLLYLHQSVLPHR